LWKNTYPNTAVDLSKVESNFISVSGIIKPGYQVASGQAKDSPYEQGTIAMQLPFFRNLGLDLSNFFRGTLNISLAPHSFKIVQPKYTFPLVKWHPNYEAETFSFSACQLVYLDRIYTGLIYYPHPETKLGHFQDDTIIEVIAPPIPSIKYSDAIELKVIPDEIKIIFNEL